MNAQAHMPDQVPNQNGAQIPVIPQQNGAPLSAPMQNTGNSSDLINARGFMQRKIFDILMRRHQPTHEIQAKKLKDIVRRLEEGLFRNATSKEEYMNFDTLESRLHVMIKRQSPHGQSFSQHNNAPSIGTMIPTSGLSTGGNTNLMGPSSGDTSLMSIDGNNSSGLPIMNIGNSFATGNISSGGLQNVPFTSSDGDGYGVNNTEVSVSGDFYGNAVTMGSSMRTQNMAPTGIRSHQT